MPSVTHIARANRLSCARAGIVVAFVFLGSVNLRAEDQSPIGGISGLVKDYRNSLVLITGATGAGSGFVANLGGTNYLVTNAHVAAEARGASLKSLDGTGLQAGPASVAVGHDIFRIQLAPGGKPFEVLPQADENASIGDEVVVLGNAEGAGVVNTIRGKIVGLGPNLVEVDAPFVPGNSGSPIIHLKTGKVVGVATYLMIKKYDAATKQAFREPVVRRFGYRLDSVKVWQPVDWREFFAEATEMEKIDHLTEDLGKFLFDLGKNHRVTPGMHNNPIIKNRIDAWMAQKTRRLSATDSIANDQNFVSFLKSACQSDVGVARTRLTYDYFQRGLVQQQQARNEISGIFGEIIKGMHEGR
jgi:hypothetical protein